jgi:sensor histidine kinase regulating citrate/malate metabolism
VSDNGIGFAPELQTNFFNFGYSTKARGSGFGLHATALFVHEMDGDIRLQSDGPNLGATLVMDLPLKKNSVAAAADAD